MSNQLLQTVCKKKTTAIQKYNQVKLSGFKYLSVLRYSKITRLPWEWDGNGNHIHPMGIPIVNLVGNPMGIRWEFLWESSGNGNPMGDPVLPKSCGNSYGNPMENPVGNPVETGWEWELKFHYHGNPANLVLTKFGICLCCLYGVTV